jgi:hypothetical protein
MTQSPDDKLLILGRRLEEIWPRLRRLRTEHAALGREAKDYARNLTGVEPGSDGSQDAARLTERWLDSYGEMSERNGFSACDRNLQAMYRELDPIMREILCLPARSAAGLRTKTLAALVANDYLWDEPLAELDWDSRFVRSLIEASCAIAGLQLPRDHDPDDAPVNAFVNAVPISAVRH